MDGASEITAYVLVLNKPVTIKIIILQKYILNLVYIKLIKMRYQNLAREPFNHETGWSNLNMEICINFR